MEATIQTLTNYPLTKLCFVKINESVRMIDSRYLYDILEINGLRFSKIDPYIYEFKVKSTPGFVEDTKIISLFLRNGVQFSRDPLAENIMFGHGDVKEFNLVSNWLTNLTVNVKCNMHCCNLVNLRRLTINKFVEIRGCEIESLEEIICNEVFRVDSFRVKKLVIQTDKNLQINGTVDTIVINTKTYRINAIKCNTLIMKQPTRIHSITFENVIFEYTPTIADIEKLKSFVSAPLKHHYLGFVTSIYDKDLVKYTRVNKSNEYLPKKENVNYADMFENESIWKLNRQLTFIIFDQDEQIENLDKFLTTLNMNAVTKYANKTTEESKRIQLLRIVKSLLCITSDLFLRLI